MTKLLYQTDAYLKEFSATIASVDAETRAVVLDQSAFYPGGGGQPCDFRGCPGTARQGRCAASRLRG